MSRFHLAPIVNRQAFGSLVRLEVHCPPLATQVRPGQALLVRCADRGNADPLLRQPFFCAGSDHAHGLIRLLAADDDSRQGWLARQHPGMTLDIFGPVGHPFELQPRTGNLLLIGEGEGLAALVALAHVAVARHIAVVLLAAAANDAFQIPPFLLPPDVEYQFTVGSALDLLDQQPVERRFSTNMASSPIVWADQVCAALPDTSLRPFADALRAQRLRWSRGFAHVLLNGQLPCGTGACFSCLVDTRDGWRTRCKDGPVFDLRSLQL